MFAGGYKIRDENAVHFLTFAVVEWVDVFTRSFYCDIVVDSLNHCVKEKGLLLHAWIIMPNHMHLIASAREGFKLSGFLRDFKKHTSTTIVDEIEKNTRESRKNWMLWIFKKAGEKNSRNTGHQFWQQENHPIELRTDEMILQRLNYLHNNPVRAGIVREADHYVYSSAIDYSGGKGLVKLEMI
jgi:REP element-mobilizing transposase RayT